MSTAHGDEIVDEFYRRGTGELAMTRSQPKPKSGVPDRRPPAASPPTAQQAAGTSTAPAKKKRGLSREQRLVLALARLLAARPR